MGNVSLVKCLRKQQIDQHKEFFFSKDPLGLPRGLTLKTLGCHVLDHIGEHLSDSFHARILFSVALCPQHRAVKGMINKRSLLCTHKQRMTSAIAPHPSFEEAN